MLFVKDLLIRKELTLPTLLHLTRCRIVSYCDLLLFIWFLYDFRLLFRLLSLGCDRQRIISFKISLNGNMLLSPFDAYNAVIHEPEILDIQLFLNDFSELRKLFICLDRKSSTTPGGLVKNRDVDELSLHFLLIFGLEL